ncbi:MAG TPA: PEP-CTERM sorting domain-containing protein [Candidatus Limnocylindria bacterium]|nr:PEP-CTERM sorting domain-containing protein [Candidatus Limnocylindria bacterium]
MVEASTSFAPNRNITDNSAAGISDTRTVSLADNYAITSLSVSVNIDPRSSGMFNGDIYLTLAKGEEAFSVLLNRTGTRDDSSFGYGDNGFHITFSDSAANDIHMYRLTATGSNTTPLASNPLTGTWQPDARNIDPDSVVNTDPRTAFLSAFKGLTPNGQWTLFAADLSSGGTAKLSSWSLNFVMVPEPGETASAVAAVLSGFACLRLRRRK